MQTMLDQGMSLKDVRTTLYDSPTSLAEEDANFKSLMIAREGRRNDVYPDIKGLPTVGIGHLVLPSDNLKLGDRITDAQVDAFYQKDSVAALQAARSQAAIAGITSVPFIPYLASVNLQLGTNWTSKWPNTWKMIVDGRYQEAAQSLYGSPWADQTLNRVQDFQRALLSLPPKTQ